MAEKIVNINELHDFKGNPYIVKDDEEMENLVESIKQYGLLEPLLVRKRDEGGFEVLSGHRRKYACRKAGIEKIPVLVRDMDKDMATITLVDSNLQRENILPSEKAFAYKMKLEAIKHQGKTYGQNVHKSRDSIADGISGRQIQRYIRLTELIPPILQLVDENKMSMSPAIEISYLTKMEQEDLFETMETEERTPSLSQAIRMRELSKQGRLDMDKIFDIMTEQKPNEQEQIKFKVDSLKKYFPRNYTIKQMQDTIENLLKQYQKKWKNIDLER